MIFDFIAISICVIIFLLYFFTSIAYMFKKPKFIVNKKVVPMEKFLDDKALKHYLNSVGKLNAYTSILFIVGFFNTIFIDKLKVGSGINLVGFFCIISILNSIFQRRIKARLISKANENKR